MPDFMGCETSHGEHMREIDDTARFDETSPIETTEEHQRYLTLTERERSVLHLVASGFTAPEIGRQLLISPKTVDTYKQRINEKLSLSHRSDYVTLALRLGLLS
jgi:DNA-binding NarL/FixJ family response regulator